MGFKRRNIRTSTRVASELQELLVEVADVISNENKQTAAQLTGYLDALQSSAIHPGKFDGSLQQAYMDGVAAARTINQV